MSEILQAIALLCQVSTGYDYHTDRKIVVDAYQLKCQQYYISCFYDTKANLAECVKSRKIKE